MITLAGCSARNAVTVPSPEKRADSKRLGTQWGENVASSVTNVNAQRITSQPTAMASIYYNANSISGYPLQSYSVSLQNVNMRIQSEGGDDFDLASNYADNNSMQTYYLKGKEGQRYQLYFYNSDPRQAYEVIATVDGVDVVSGQRGSVQNTGYIVYPAQSLTISGFRKSNSDVAAFRFSKPKDSYAAHSVAGDVNNTGIIGVAIYPTSLNLRRDCGQQAFPQDNGYAPQPCNKN